MAVVDGTAYGLEPYFRFSIVDSDEVLADAVRRIAKAVGALRVAEPVEALPA